MNGPIGHIADSHVNFAEEGRGSVGTEWLGSIGTTEAVLALFRFGLVSP